MKVWVLTREENDYDQHGDYFVAVFKKFPTLLAIWEALDSEENSGARTGISTNDVELFSHIQKGGGRRYPEETWYHLREIEML